MNHQDAKQASKPVRCYEVWIKGREFRSSVNAISAGQAKMEYIRRLDDCFPDLNFIQLRARCVGRPQTSEQFKRNAVYRGIPKVRCGDPVKVGEAFGVVVDHNASANLVILFDQQSPKHAGRRLSVHPADCEFPQEKQAA